MIRFRPLFLPLHFVLFGLSPCWTSHLRRSPSNHSHGYAFDVGRPARHPFGANAAHCANSLQAHSSADQPNCFAHHTLIPKPFMQFADKVKSPCSAKKALVIAGLTAKAGTLLPLAEDGIELADDRLQATWTLSPRRRAPCLSEEPLIMPNGPAYQARASPQLTPRFGIIRHAE